MAIYLLSGKMSRLQSADYWDTTFRRSLQPVFSSSYSSYSFVRQVFPWMELVWRWVYQEGWRLPKILKSDESVDNEILPWQLISYIIGSSSGHTC